MSSLIEQHDSTFCVMSRKSENLAAERQDCSTFLFKCLLRPCTLLCLNENIAKTIPAARLNEWQTRASQTIRCDVGTFFDVR